MSRSRIWCRSSSMRRNSTDAQLSQASAPPSRTGGAHKSKNMKECKMANQAINEKRREFLGTSALVLSTVVVGGSIMTSSASAQSTAAKEPAVIGYRNEKGVTIERVTYKARNMG